MLKLNLSELELEFSGYFLPKDGKNIKDCMSISYKFPKFVLECQQWENSTFLVKNNNSSKDNLRYGDKAVCNVISEWPLWLPQTPIKG